MPDSAARSPGGASSEKVIGFDRDPEEITERLVAGGSVLVVGSLGSGKSHLSRTVAALLKERDAHPLVVRGGSPQAAAPLRDLDADDPSLVLVIDDAHLLDEPALEMISHAVYDGRIRALILAAAEPSGARPIGLPPVLTQLWRDGGAARHDLQQLDDLTADALMSCFVGGEALDSVTRAVVTQRAAGSRMLLREFALDAAEALSDGGDPLWETRGARPGSRLADALAVVVSRYSEEQRLALALVNRLDGIERALLLRAVSPAVIDGLIAARVVRDTGDATRTLHATAPLAIEAENQLPPGLLDSAVDDLVTHILTHPGATPSPPLMRAAAAAWRAGREGVPFIGDVPPELRGIVLENAADAANTDGRADLALAYVNLGFAVDGHAGLYVQASRAHARLRQTDEAYAQVSRLDPASMSAREQRRVVRWWASLIGWQPAGHDFDEIDGWLDEAGITDSRVRVELEVQRAEACYLDMDFTGGEQHAVAVLSSPHAQVLARLRASVVAAMCAAQLGRGEEGLALLARAERLNRDPVTGRPISVRSELALICFQAFAGMLAGCVPPHLDDRLRFAVGVAAQRKDRSGLALAGIVSGVALGLARGDDRRSALEFGAALDRIDRIEFAVFRPLVADLRASALARLGRISEARTVLEEIEIEQLRVHRLFRYSRHAAEFDISAACGELGTAEGALLAAERAREEGDPEAALSVTDLRRRVRLSALTAAAVTPAAHREPSDTRGEAERILTDREHEISLLVARRLSNKEIAQQLFLSVRTVESHIYSARGKLGAGSRRELGERVLEQDAGVRSAGGRL